MRSHDHVILFDGVCNLCNYFVQLTIRNDPEAKFKFASLQSDVGTELLREFDLPTTDAVSFVYIRNGRCLQRSTAALEIVLLSI